MATRPLFTIADKSSTVSGVAGAALAAELCTQAFPESSNKRQWFTFEPVAPTTAGATPVELFIDGIQGFRFRIAERSTCVIRGMAVYNNSVAASNVAFDVMVAVQNVGGTLTFLAAATVTKLGTSAATFTVNIDTPSQSLTFTATGVAGDTQGVWEFRTTGICEVTDLGN